MVFRIQDTPHYQLYHYIAEWIRWLVRWMKHLALVVEEWVALYSGIDADIKNASQRELPVVDPAVAFYDIRKSRLLATYRNGGAGAEVEVEAEDWNSNISAEFYDKQKYKAVLEEYNNVLETQWKTRVLMETTPR